MPRRRLVTAILDRPLQSRDFLLPDFGKLQHLGSKVLRSSLVLRKLGRVSSAKYTARTPGPCRRGGLRRLPRIWDF
jgi:hypothetical protein